MKLRKLNNRFLSFFLAIILGFTCIFEFSKNVFADDNLGTWKIMNTQIYDTNTNNIKNYYLDAFGTVALNNKIYTIGGFDNNTFSNKVQEYDLSSGKWIEKTPLNERRQYPAVTVLNGKIYAIGGTTSNGPMNTMEEYDPGTDKWTEKAPMNTKRVSFAAETVNNKIYVMGGEKNGGVIVNSVEEYDPASDKWTTKSSMIQERRYFAGTVLDGKIYAIGGEAFGGRLVGTVEEYDPAVDKWTVKTAIKGAARKGLAATSLNGKIYIIGGMNGNDTLNLTEEYDPKTDKWVEKAPLNLPRQALGAVTVNNKIYAIGGVNVKVGCQNTIEEYTPSENISSIPTNLTARAGDAKVKLSWDAASGAIYNIKRSETSGGPYTTIGTSTQAIYTDTKVTNGKTYYYVVTAVNGTLESENSNEVQATPNADNSIVLNKTTDTINVGQTDNLTAKTMPSGIGVTWSSSDSGIASVDNNGTVTGVKEGTATITCTTKDGKTAECIVTVTKSSASPSESGDRAVLTIEMNNGKTKEYDLSKDELNAFVTWYDSRSKGTAAAYYVFDAPATGSYINKKDTISFNQINDYEVQEYNK